MSFLLDTDTCVYAIKQDPAVLGRLLACERRDVFVSVITEAELRAGAARSSEPVRSLRRLENFLSPIEVLPFESQDARSFATVRSVLERKGTPIGPLDTLIAAHALARGLTVVTNNTREFRRVKGLPVENWKP